MFDQTHYVPLIRWKMGEEWALKMLPSDIKSSLTPVVELIPRNFEQKKIAKSGSLSNRFTDLSKEILDSLGSSPVFMDLRHVEGDLLALGGPAILTKLGRTLVRRGLHPIPVIGLRGSRAEGTAASSTAAKSGHGIAFRLDRADVGNPSLEDNLNSLLNRLNLRPNDVHLIVDNQFLDVKLRTILDLCNTLPYLRRWKTFTLLSGAFVKDLSGIEKNTQYELPRADWIHWRSQVTGLPGSKRVPTYGDYTIQHGYYGEPPPRFNASASIRYTSNNCWVIMRGEGIFNDDGPGHAGYLGNAILLADRPEYCGENFSAGDQYIKQMSAQTKRTGSPETWIRAGINHHLTFVVRQIARLFGTAAAA